LNPDVEKARDLRKSITPAERQLWSALRGRKLSGHKFRRQHPIGWFVVDFACVKRRLIIEVDGGQHAENPDDGRRTKWLEAQGWRVIRFWNGEIVENLEAVADRILRCLDGTELSVTGRHPHPPNASRWGPLRSNGRVRVAAALLPQPAACYL